ncbi:MAG: murein L,D-transpeptidase, partial [Verrucomicrobiaceae bacterium]
MNPSRRLVVSIDEQILRVIDGDECIRQFPVSTATKGMGFTPDTFRTPTGQFRIATKIGDGAPSGTIFKKREPVGCWKPGDVTDGDLVLTRVIQIEGLDADNANSLE